MSTLNSTFFHVFIVLPFCTIRSLFYCIFSLLGSAIVRLPLLPASHAPYFRSYASCFTSSSNSCYPAPFVLQIILISVKLNEGTDSDILMFFTAECLNRYLLVLSYQSYKNSRYLPDQSLTPAIITIRCTTASLDREMMHQRHDNNYSTF